MSYNCFRLVVNRNYTSTLDTVMFSKIVLFDSSVFRYPPAPLGSNVEELSGKPYGNKTYTVSASSSEGTAWHLFDDILHNTYWQTADNNTSSNSYNGTTTTNSLDTQFKGEWVQIQLPHAIQLSSYGIYPFASFEFRAPKTFFLLGANILPTTTTPIWTLIDSQNIGSIYNSPVTFTIKNIPIIVSTRISTPVSTHASTSVSTSSSYIILIIILALVLGYLVYLYVKSKNV